MNDRNIQEDFFKQELSKLYEKIERIQGDVQALQGISATQHELAYVRERLDKKIDSETFREGMRTKVSVEEFNQTIAKKIGLEDLEEILDSKVDGQDLERIIQVIEKKADTEAVEELIEIIRGKAEQKDLEMITVGLNKKADKKVCDEAIDQIAMVRKEIESLFEELDGTFGDFKAVLEKYRGDIDACLKETAKKVSKAEIVDLKTQVSKKIDSGLFIEELAKIKEDNIREVKTTKLELDKVNYS